VRTATPTPPALVRGAQGEGGRRSARKGDSGHDLGAWKGEKEELEDLWEVGGGDNIPQLLCSLPSRNRNPA